MNVKDALYKFLKHLRTKRIKELPFIFTYAACEEWLVTEFSAFLNRTGGLLQSGRWAERERKGCDLTVFRMGTSGLKKDDVPEHSLEFKVLYAGHSRSRIRELLQDLKRQLEERRKAGRASGFIYCVWNRDSRTTRGEANAREFRVSCRKLAQKLFPRAQFFTPHDYRMVELLKSSSPRIGGEKCQVGVWCLCVTRRR